MKRKHILKIGSLGVLASLGLGLHAQKETRPNIIVILVDDLGYSDLGCYGGEIETPNIDALAENGVRFNSFYNAGRSCPTRASLLTGLYQHQAGIGRMTFNQNLPGYQGNLTYNGVTIAEVLKSSGYNTGMIGKWHVVETPLRPDQCEWLNHQVSYSDFADKKNYPTSRGFDDYYGIIYGVADYFDPFSLVNGDKPVESVPDDYYITTALSDSTVAYVDRYAKEDKPFFLYLAYTAPHWPLHALPEDIKKYENKYLDGWDAMRNKRYEKMRQKGIFDQESNYLSPRFPVKDWATNPTKDWDAHAMAVHAAMVDRVDQGIGEIIEALKKNGQLDNTLILFMSDNGCSNERCENYPAGENDRPDMTRLGKQIVYPKNKQVLPGSETTFASVGTEWANAANTPFRFWKAKMYEGGICTPMIAYWPKGIKIAKNTVTSQPGHVMDIMATCVDLAGAKYPKEYHGNKIIPMEGLSLKPIFEKGKRKGHDYLGFEHIGEQALIKDGWKIVKVHKKDNWELYNLNEDRSEMVDLSSKYPAKLKELEKKYDEWAKRSLVVPAPPIKD